MLAPSKASSHELVTTMQLQEKPAAGNDADLSLSGAIKL
jgi:hypothetical protein